MVQIPAWARVLVLSFVAFGLYFAAPNFFPRTQVLDLDGYPVQGWLAAEGAVIVDDPTIIDVNELARNDFVGDLPADRVVIGPAPEGAGTAILLNGDEVRLDTRAPPPIAACPHPLCAAKST